MSPLIKMSGAGNTFLFGKKSDWLALFNKSEPERSQFIKTVCSKEDGFFADGFVLVDRNQQGYRWDFYNSDGSPAEMCGNAARCAAVFIKNFISREEKEFSLATVAGPVQLKFLSDDLIQVQMPKVLTPEMSWEINHQGVQRIFFLTNTGVPHAVLEVSKISHATDLKELAKTVRSHTFFRPDGTNVTFYAVQDLDKIDAVTFERGVEDFTLACGTGAVAAARAYRKKSGKNRVTVEMPGGSLLVEIDGKESVMSGGAKIIGEVKPLEGK